MRLKENILKSTTITAEVTLGEKINNTLVVVYICLICFNIFNLAIFQKLSQFCQFTSIQKVGRLDLDKTLSENGILKNDFEFDHPPSLWLYYADDFTIAQPDFHIVIITSK